MRSLIAQALCISALLSELSAQSDAHAANRRSSKVQVEQVCQVPIGWADVASREPRFVVFGEMHGTQQAPAFIGDIACALAARGERILVAIEHSSTENDAFQKAWHLSNAEFPEALKRAGWADRDDGVGSEAMLALLVRLHNLARLGQSIDIVAFNGAKDAEQSRRFSDLPGQGPHDAAQAENIRVAAAAHAYDHVLVLVGNVHARKRPVEHFRAQFEPMVMRLGPPSSIITLNMKTAGGTAWNCELKPGVTPKPGKPITQDDIACGSYPISGDADLPHSPFIALGALQGMAIDPDYDGVFWLGKVNASSKAVVSH
ncbi:hypothetical protein QE361_001501 [Sphingomonas sp. SORGH_AS802]|uniref:hypothetical protein n=2 Tax=unclassified Sphingomonas TaxID=196159 RepID=UPI00285F5045|nr:hypothetical protein [Sphingomonas sp. SORGH_AS_0802]MDR6134526.1 hypothetical protein [Sphingomonas sp. SORGH_AS_0802]